MFIHHTPEAILNYYIDVYNRTNKEIKNFLPLRIPYLPVYIGISLN